jgi:hypothetical protein
MSEINLELGLIPIIVGITGHRDISESDSLLLETSINESLDNFQCKYPHSPKVLLSGLAEGIDQISAKSALSRGWQVHAVLALPEEEFIQTFDQQNAENSKKIFKELLSKSKWVTVASPSRTPSPECFVNVSNLIASKAQWLIACWDGLENDTIDGGTSYTVNLFRNGKPSILPVVPDNGPVKWITTRRLKNYKPDPIGKILDLAPTTIKISNDSLEKISDETYLKTWEEILLKIDSYNKDAKILIKNNYNKLNLKRKNYLQIKDSINESAERASWLFAIADELSQIAGNKRSSRLTLLIISSIIALALHALYAESPIKHWIWQVMSISIAFFAYLTVINLPKTLRNIFPSLHNLNTRKIENDYLDYRALAEACRVQYFWDIATLKLSVSDYYLREQRDETEWIRQSIRTTTQNQENNSKDTDIEIFKYILNAWIRDQKRFFIHSKKSMSYHSKKERSLSLISNTLFIIAIVLAILSLILEWLDIEYFDIEWLEFAYTCSLIISGASKVYQETQGHAEHAKSYEKMALMMLLTEEKMNAHQNNLTTLKEIVKEIGIAALNENSDWLRVHRERPSGPIFGG